MLLYNQSDILVLFVHWLHVWNILSFLSQTLHWRGIPSLSSHQGTTPPLPPASQQAWCGTWVSCPPSTCPPPKQSPLPPQAPWTSAPRPASAAVPAVVERRMKDAAQTPPAPNPCTHTALASGWNAPVSCLTSVPLRKRRRGRRRSQPPAGQPSSASTAPKSTPASGHWRCTSAHTPCPACAPPAERLSPGLGCCAATSAHTQVRPSNFKHPHSSARVPLKCWVMSEEIPHSCCCGAVTTSELLSLWVSRSLLHHLGCEVKDIHDNQTDEHKHLISRRYHVGKPSVDPALIDQSLCLMSQEQWLVG